MDRPFLAVARLTVDDALPAAAVRPPAPSRGLLQVPDSIAVRKLLCAAIGTPYELPLLLAATGMRRGEVLGLRWSAVNLDAAELG